MEQKTPALAGKSEYFKFRLMQGNLTSEGTFVKTKNVGMAFLVKGRHSYTLKLWTLMKDKFILVPKKNDSRHFLVLTRDEDQALAEKWRSNIVGSGELYPAAGLIRMDFDLLEKPIYMSIFPESQTQMSQGLSQ